MKRIDLVLSFGTLSTIIIIAFVWIFRDIISYLLLLGGYIIAGLLVLAIYPMYWYAIENMRIVRAVRKKSEAEARRANITIVQDKKQTWIIDHRNNHTHSLSLDPRIYPNGHYTKPQPDEIANWQSLNPPKSKMTIDQNIPLLDEPRLDLLTIFSQLGQTYAVIAGQQVGKTFQARHMAYYWLSKNIQPIVIGPKWDKGEWEECKLLGGNGNYATVEHGIELVRQEVAKRHADSERGHKEHAILPIFFDDWTPIVRACGNAKPLIFEAATLYASVNILLYFILHSDTAYAWGVDKEGAALKNNFIKLFISPGYDENGILIRENNKGVIRFVGGEEKPVRLFDTPIPSFENFNSQVVESKSIIKQYPEDELKVVEMKGSGHSYREITFQVWGQWGDFYNQKVDEILERWGEK